MCIALNFSRVMSSSWVIFFRSIERRRSDRSFFLFVHTPAAINTISMPSGQLRAGRGGAGSAMPRLTGHSSPDECLPFTPLPEELIKTSFPIFCYFFPSPYTLVIVTTHGGQSSGPRQFFCFNPLPPRYR